MKTPFEKLSLPFPLTDVKWRSGPTNASKDKCLALAYLKSRSIMDRLDQVIGPANWTNSYTTGPAGGVISTISINCDGDWISKSDGAENPEYEPIKGGLSAAFKRAAVLWGIGRYLYRLPDQWIDCKLQGKTVVITGTPVLPAWAMLPNPAATPAATPAASPTATPTATPTAKATATPAATPAATSKPNNRAVNTFWATSKAKHLDRDTALSILDKVHMNFEEALLVINK